MTSKFKYWTKVEENALLAKIRNKIPLEKISADIGRSKKAIQMRINKLVFDMSENGTSTQELALLMDMKETEISTCIESHKKKDNDYKTTNDQISGLTQLINNQNDIITMLMFSVKNLRKEVAELKQLLINHV